MALRQLSVQYGMQTHGLKIKKKFEKFLNFLESQSYQQMKRHKIKAIMCVFPEASRSTRVDTVAWHDGQTKRVEPGPTATDDSIEKITDVKKTLFF